MRRTVGIVLSVLLAVVVLAGFYYVTTQQRANEAATDLASGRGVKFTGPPPPFCVCHSKSTAMRRMHLNFGLSDCAICHHTANMMDRRKRPKPSASKLRHRQRTMAICRQCHHGR